jgi:hypothetical protein
LAGLLHSVEPKELLNKNILHTNEIPIVVVQSTDDVFVNPRNAEIFLQSSLPNNRKLVMDVADCLDEGKLTLLL